MKIPLFFFAMVVETSNRFSTGVTVSLAVLTIIRTFLRRSMEDFEGGVFEEVVVGDGGCEHAILVKIKVALVTSVACPEP